MLAAQNEAMAESSEKDLAMELDFQSDLDLFHVMPLNGLPFGTPALRRARMIKNQKLETMVEVFRDQSAGSGQVAIKDLEKQFGESLKRNPNDMKMLTSLSYLKSYDPFSLRITLRDLDLLENDLPQVNLSAKKRQQLEKFMKTFTRPLIQQIFGAESDGDKSFVDLLQIFKHPDAHKVRENLESLAKNLNITIADIPRFLEDFSDVFLSLSYYQDTIDILEPKLELLTNAVRDLRENYQYRQDRNIMAACEDTVDRVNRLFVFVTGRLESFSQSTEGLWEKMTAENFNKVRTLITGYHVSVGGMLCTLSVKLNAWAEMFPTSDAGSPMKRIEFLMSEMRRGVDMIDTLFDETPALASLNS